LVVGRATTRETQQSALSKKLTPPVKWSYLKVIGWSVLVFVCVGWLVFYANTVMTNATTVLSAPLTLFSLISGAVFVLLVFLVWRHNHSTYRQRYADGNALSFAIVAEVLSISCYSIHELLGPKK
jgi:hypothetical protein